jgi:hypothetical protein
MRTSILAACGVLLVSQPPARATEDIEGVTAVASKVSSDYVRTKLPDGSFQPESYAFGEGGNWGGEISDATIDKLHFIDVARTIAAPLEGQRYLPSKDPNRTKLLIMVYRGTTVAPEPPETDPLYQVYYQDLAQFRRLMDQGYVDQADAVLTAGLHVLAMANRQRDRLDFKNAGMIGYESSGLIGTDRGEYVAHTALGVDQRDQVSEIEENRFSVSERHNAFDKALPGMARYAAEYFGQPSNGLVRTRVPEGNVEIKEPTLIEFLFEQKK